jgi:acetyl-CoA carboxylase biotin carboxyl carrier protein
MPVPAMLPPAPIGRLTPTDGLPAQTEPETSGRAEASRSQLLEVKSPMVGTFYGAPEPGAKPYVAVGDRVAKGQILCIIEAMKLMNEIESKAAGRILKVLVENGQPVEYGQPLFLLEPPR